MGSLTVPSSGSVYVDADAVIYTVEKHPDFGPLLQPLWLAARSRQIEVLRSEILLVEVLVGPMRSGDAALEQAYERALGGSDVRLLPTTQALFRDAARIRAANRLRTPDAIHAATGLAVGCALFVTNDAAFRRVPGLPVVILSDLLVP